MQFYVYDNAARRYFPPPGDKPDSEHPDTSQIEDLVANLRKVDIADVYFDGRRGVLAYRIRARSNLPQYQERNQEHFAVWRTEQEESTEMLFEQAATNIKWLFQRSEWEMPPDPNESRGDYVTYPQRVVDLAGIRSVSEIARSEVSERLELIVAAITGEHGRLRIGTPSFDKAQQLLRLLSESNGTVLIGDFNKPDELDRLAPDVVIEYGTEYDWLEAVDSETASILKDVDRSIKDEKRQEALNRIDEGLRILHEEYSASTELEALNRLVPAVSKTSHWNHPSDVAAELDLEDLPDPAKTILTDIRLLHDWYDFDRYHDRSVPRGITDRVRGTDSPFEIVAQKLNDRRDTLREDLYESKAAQIEEALDDAVKELGIVSHDAETIRERLLSAIDNGRDDDFGDSPLLFAGLGIVIGAVVMLVVLGLTAAFVGVPFDVGLDRGGNQLAAGEVNTTTVMMDAELRDGTISITGETTADRVNVQVANASGTVLNTTTEVRDGRFAIDHPVGVQGQYTITVQAGAATDRERVFFDRPAQLTVRRPKWGATITGRQNTSNGTVPVRVVGTTNVAQVRVQVRNLSSDSVIQSRTAQATNESFETRLNMSAGTYVVSVTAEDRVGANVTVTRPVTVSSST